MVLIKYPHPKQFSEILSQVDEDSCCCHCMMDHYFVVPDIAIFSIFALNASIAMLNSFIPTVSQCCNSAVQGFLGISIAVSERNAERWFNNNLMKVSFCQWGQFSEINFEAFFSQMSWKIVWMFWHKTFDTLSFLQPSSRKEHNSDPYLRPCE